MIQEDEIGDVDHDDYPVAFAQLVAECHSGDGADTKLTRIGNATGWQAAQVIGLATRPDQVIEFKCIITREELNRQVESHREETLQQGARHSGAEAWRAGDGVGILYYRCFESALRERTAEDRMFWQAMNDLEH